jgi:hypothetical protein
MTPEQILQRLGLAFAEYLRRSSATAGGVTVPRGSPGTGEGGAYRRSPCGRRRGGRAGAGNAEDVKDIETACRSAVVLAAGGVARSARRARHPRGVTPAAFAFTRAGK